MIGLVNDTRRDARVVAIELFLFTELACKLVLKFLYTHTHTQPFNGPLSRTTRVSRYQKIPSPTHTHEEEEGFVQTTTVHCMGAPPLEGVL